MEPFTLHILGCGSALPTQAHWPSSQAIVLRGKVYIVDCGEGCQLMLRTQRVNFSRIVAIFISHLHGDHLFGLPGLISTLGLLGRTATLHIYGPRGLKAYIRDTESRFLQGNGYDIEVHEHGDKASQLIFEDPSVKVSTLPLLHRIPTTGYLFEEKCAPLHLNKIAANFYGVPLAAYPEILIGMPYTMPDGREIANKHLTRPGRRPRKYAYCSDTAYNPKLPELVHAVDLLYHEATYAEADRLRAKQHWHSTAQDAAKIALAAEAKRLLLGHFSSRYPSPTLLLEEARVLFSETDLAQEGLKIEI